MSRRRCCCGRGCGCSDRTDCFPIGDRLIATSISSSETGGCDDLNGIRKFFIWNGYWWEPESDGDPGDDGYHPCLFLYPGMTKYATLVCDNQHVYCPENPEDDPCHDYLLIMNFPQCGGTDPLSVNGICPSECECDPFRLRFNGLVFDGGPQGPYSGGIYNYLCCVDSCWPDGTTDSPEAHVYTVDWEFTREYSCCCPNLDKDDAPDLEATIDSDPGKGPCGGTMEGAHVTLTRTGTGTDCKVYDGDIVFDCEDEDEHTVHFEMRCVGDDDGIFCCWDYEGTVSWTDECCDPADNSVTVRALDTCDCNPPNFRFGPFRLWRADEEDACCQCADEFWVQVTEAIP